MLIMYAMIADDNNHENDDDDSDNEGYDDKAKGFYLTFREPLPYVFKYFSRRPKIFNFPRKPFLPTKTC